MLIEIFYLRLNYADWLRDIAQTHLRIDRRALEIGVPGSVMAPLRENRVRIVGRVIQAIGEVALVVPRAGIIQNDRQVDRSVRSRGRGGNVEGIHAEYPGKG